MAEHDEDTWTQRIRQQLDTSARDLDAATLSRLNQATMALASDVRECVFAGDGDRDLAATGSGTVAGTTDRDAAGRFHDVGRVREPRTLRGARFLCLAGCAAGLWLDAHASDASDAPSAELLLYLAEFADAEGKPVDPVRVDSELPKEKPAATVPIQPPNDTTKSDETTPHPEPVAADD